MDDPFRSNPQAETELDLNEESDSSEPEEEPPMKPPEGLRLSQMATVYPPKPCDRCVRMSRACKGIAGSRCEYCKRLKQKCSNATGPARGRHATRLAILAAAAAKGISPPPQTAPATSSSSWGVRPKRKASSGKARATSQSGDEDEYDDGHEPPTKLNKKRRLNKNVLNPLQSKILERITELEGAVHELQNHTVREVERIKQLIGRLKADVHELDPAD